MGRRCRTVEALRFATKRSMGPRRSLHAFGSKEIGQQREGYLPCLGGVGRPTHDLYCERKSRHREVLRPHFGVRGPGTFFPRMPFLQPAFAERPRGRRCCGKCQGPVTLAGSRLSCRTLPTAASATALRAPSRSAQCGPEEGRCFRLARNPPATHLCGIDSH
jgi:hypothetical protein